jgi:hypothetical protein
MATNRVLASVDLVRVTGSFASGPTDTGHVSGDQVGGLITFANAIAPSKQSRVRSCEVVGARMVDVNDITAINWNLVLFGQWPTPRRCSPSAT